MLSALLVGAVLVVSGCFKGGETPGVLSSLDELGKGEGRLSLLALPGYVEAGKADKSVDWVSGFTKRTGCQVSVTTVPSASELAEQVRADKYDGVAATGEISRQLILDKRVAAINTKLIPHFGDVVPGLRRKAWNSYQGDAYGVPIGRTANLLAWRTDAVQPSPKSTSVLYDTASAQRGKVSVYDSPLALADAALFLKATKPELKIENPYALTKRQFDAAVEAARAQRQLSGKYWRDFVPHVRDFVDKKTTVGLMPQVVAELTRQQRAPVEMAMPTEDSTGSADTWMVSARAQHPNCMYRWLDHTLRAEVNAQVAEHLGQAPSVATACGQTTDPQFCATFHALDEAFYERVWLWTTPTAHCVNTKSERKGERCVDLTHWREAWRNLRKLPVKSAS